MGTENQTRPKLEDDVDALFKLPLAEFTGARNDLVTRLKKDGRPDDASLVKTLAKPSMTAWAVNQLYWNHREEFDRLLAIGQRFGQAPSSHRGGSMADLRESLDARREVISQLSDLATVLLSDAGHNPTPDTMHRITTTLEAISAYATLSNGPTPGRLTQDVDPPGFESLASLIPSNSQATKAAQPSKAVATQKASSATATARQATSPVDDAQKARQAAEERRARIAAAKASLQEARKSLTEARSRVQRSEAAQKKAHTEARDADAETRRAEKLLREAEKLFKKASATSQDAEHRAKSVAAETAEAAHAVEEAKRTIERVSKELESILQVSRG